MLTSKKITQIAVFAALYAVGGVLPGFPIVGVSGAEIDIVRALEPMYGIIFGPLYGAITALIGAVIGKIITGDSIGLFFTPLGAISAFTAGALTREKVFGVRGWKVSGSLLIFLVFGWFLTTPGKEIPVYASLHIFALLIIIIFHRLFNNLLGLTDWIKRFMLVALLSYSSTMTGHMLGTLIWIFLFKPPPVAFLGLLPITMGERLLISSISTVLIIFLVPRIREHLPIY